ncbi:LysO family transporter [Desulfobulbus alkaliphilus]|uniref:LysO family transporter n=1 Tax=Desulfobulbus alkaliphilus TaxID=869814 RepID=UPI0019648537|nr:LysO family transporter [Desulfobulbus alkaliphilus]MBM9535854.1 LysO family transporter [Desulfobulbus alkaliphilus]
MLFIVLFLVAGIFCGLLQRETSPLLPVSRSLTLLILPFLVKYAGKLSTIASGGATSMDTTLPIVVRFSGQQFVMISIYSGLIITFLVPVLVTFFLT